MKLIVYVVTLLVCALRSVAMPTEDSCRFRARQRVECGWSGITASTCRSRGCCWDDSIKTSIYCYKSDERQSRQGKVGRLTRFEEFLSPVALINEGEKSTMRTCSVEYRDRVQCGWPSISRRSCENRGCCFDRSSGGRPLCFQSDSLLLSSRMRALLECTWECSRTSWRKISAGYLRCGTSSPCWMLSIGQSSGNCLGACKVKQDFDVYMANITSCLRLGIEESKSSRKRCHTALPCWVSLYGKEALLCFKDFQEYGKRYGVKIPELEVNEEVPINEEENHPVPEEGGNKEEKEEHQEEREPIVPVRHVNRYLQLRAVEVEQAFEPQPAIES